MVPFDVYKTYLALKNHFTKEKYDYFVYCGKSRASLQSFYKRKDRFWFEKLSRQRNDKEVIDFFVSNFISCTDPQSLWIGEIIREGDNNYKDWQKRQQSLSYIFKEQSDQMLFSNNLEQLFDCSRQHPPILKMFLSGEICIETMVIYDRIFMYGKNFDKKLLDPVWEIVSLKIRKYSPFLHIDVFHYKKILKDIIGAP